MSAYSTHGASLFGCLSFIVIIYLVIDPHTIDIALTGTAYFASNSKNTRANGTIITPPPIPAVIAIPVRIVKTIVPVISSS